MPKKRGSGRRLPQRNSHSSAVSHIRSVDGRS
ncbi:hypothetical protein KIPB_016994, partial [Kipferlia bialata]|eukprot:g16994.t1